MKFLSKKEKGNFSEKLAIKFLISLGYKILFKNFRFKKYEIDIIAEENNNLIIVEVKFSSSEFFKIRKKQLENLSAIVKNIFFNHFCRFDVIFIKKNLIINHYKNVYIKYEF